MASNPTDDQSRYLPSELTSIRLPEIFILEEQSPDLSRWLAAVAWTLSHFDLQRLVSTEIPCPAVANSAYDRWKYWSTLVGNWLYLHLSEALQTKLFPTERRAPTSIWVESCESDFADYLINSVISFMEGKMWNRPHRITRRRDQSAKAKDAPSPRYTLKTALDELRNE
ncbi:unnamed protein product [Penicillium bialowiezense]